MAKDRANLNVQAGASVQQILFSDDLTATGVMYLDQKAGELINVTASKEVIMCAGSFQTPQMLMLSVSSGLLPLQKCYLTCEGNRT